jgi:hypothetical protein
VGGSSSTSSTSRSSSAAASSSSTTMLQPVILTPAQRQAAAGAATEPAAAAGWGSVCSSSSNSGYFMPGFASPQPDGESTRGDMHRCICPSFASPWCELTSQRLTLLLAASPCQLLLRHLAAPAPAPSL